MISHYKDKKSLVLSHWRPRIKFTADQTNWERTYSTQRKIKNGLKRLDLEVNLYVLMGLNTGITIFESRNEFYMKFSTIL